MLEDVERALQVLGEGGVILYPTDTIWGIGCDATNEEAVQRVYGIKKRRDQKSLIILVDSESMLNQYTRQVPEKALELVRISDKPLTVIYPGAVNLASNLMAEDGSIGIRIVRDPFCSTLIKKFGKAIVSTSANISGQPWPLSFSYINNEIKEAVDYIVALRQKEPSGAKPSGIIKVETDGSITIIRE
jgi:L-threonylcarbamoyladenylate synthase